MATSPIDNRKFVLQKPPINGMVRSMKSGHNPLSESPMLRTRSLKLDAYESSDDDEESENDNLVAMIRRGNSRLERSIHDPRDEGTGDSWIERNASMVRLTGKHPFNAEAPLPTLMQYGFITPVPLHYVRNHGTVPKLSWQDWAVEVTGLVKRPLRFTMDQLVNDFTSRELPVTLVCAGNRRKEQNMIKKTIGFNWGAAGVSNTLWRGVPLRDILKRCGIYSRKHGALNVCFEGAETLPGGGGSKYGTSITKELAMDPSRDIIVAYMQNGELLAPDHGFPVRMIIPGFIGGRMVKWLKRIIVTTQESDNYYHYKDNRVLPSHVDAELANAEAWWYKPEHIINELNINSAITTPLHDEILSINASTMQKPYLLKGYAYSGGGKKVTRVEVTMDDGETWQVCKLDQPEKGNKYGRFWCWCFWSLEVEVLDILGAKEIAVRAWDQSHNTQPDKLIWNVMGMMNNCWFRVKTNVCKQHKGEIGVVFEHPTVPGNQVGGWMAKQKHIEESTEPKQTMKKSISSPAMNTTEKTFSEEEVQKHKTPESAWIIVHRHVYDCTAFLKFHPGGADSILINAGTDCTEEFDAIHSDKAKNLLEEYRIGELTTTVIKSSSPNKFLRSATNLSSFQLDPIKELASPRSHVALIPREKIQCKLVSKTSLSHNVRLFRFALPGESQILGLPVGKHIFLYATVDDNLCIRAYTPTSGVDEVGHFDLVVKIYFRNQHPKYPNGGCMSQHLDSLEIGAPLDIKGPLGHIEYTGRGNFLVDGKPKFAKKLAMVAGGSGITPIYQVLKAIMKDPKDRTEVWIVYANRTEDDILLREELDGYAASDERVKVWHVINQSVREGWQYSVGSVTESILREHLPEGSTDTLALACGPPPMIKFAVQSNLEKMNYDIRNSLLVF